MRVVEQSLAHAEEDVEHPAGGRRRVGAGVAACGVDPEAHAEEAVVWNVLVVWLRALALAGMGHVTYVTYVVGLGRKGGCYQAKCCI